MSHRPGIRNVPRPSITVARERHASLDDARAAGFSICRMQRSRRRRVRLVRRERDSNPRYPFGYSGFQDRIVEHSAPSSTQLASKSACLHRSQVANVSGDNDTVTHSNSMILRSLLALDSDLPSSSLGFAKN